MVATLFISSAPFIAFEFLTTAPTAASTALLIPLLSTIGFAPAATFFIPSRIRVCAKSVAVVVPSPAISFVFVATSFTSPAPMFSKLSSSSISFAMVTPSLVISGAPNFLSITTFLPFGPKVIFTVSASLFIPASKAFLDSSPYAISFAIKYNYSLLKIFKKLNYAIIARISS